jgi:hypothetical protein
MAHTSRSRGDRFDDYIPVAERVEKFYERYPEGRIITQIVEHDRESGFVLVRTEVFREITAWEPAATGHAYEYRDAGYVQKTSYIEVAETSSVGRALAFLNFETRRGIAPRTEVERSSRSAGPRQTAPTPSSAAATTSLDEEILKSAHELGYDDAKVRRWINQKFGVTDGLEGLQKQQKSEVLKLFNEQRQEART